MTAIRPLPLLAAVALTAALASLGAPGALAATPAPSAPTPAASAAATTWSVEPAGDDKADGRVSLRHTIDPGDTVVDHVLVRNYGTAPASFLVYASDGIVTDAGDFDLLPPGEKPKDAGAWIQVGTSDDDVAPSRTVEIAAESAAVVSVRITVPENATPGDHPAGVVAQLAGQNGGGVDVMARVGVRAHLRISGELQPALALGTVTAEYTPSWNPFAPGTLEVTTVLSNSGNVRLGADAAVSAAAPFGLLPAAATTQVREVLPGQQTAVSARLDVWPGFYLSGDVGAQPLVVGEDVVPTALTTVSTGFGVWAVPWAAIILLVIVAAIAAAAVLVLRGRSTRRKARFDAAVAAAADAKARELSGAAAPTSSAPAADEPGPVTPGEDGERDAADAASADLESTRG